MSASMDFSYRLQQQELCALDTSVVLIRSTSLSAQVLRQSFELAVS